MLQTDFPNGTLLLPDTPSPASETAAIWLSDPVNAVLLVVSVALAVVNISNFSHIGGILLSSMTRPKLAMEMERNLQLARTRNITFLVLFLPLLLVCSRYRLIDPALFAASEGGIYLLEICGAFAALFLLKFLISLFARPFHAGSESLSAIRNSHFNALCVLSLVFLVTCAMMRVLGNASLKLPFYIEAVIVYVFQLANVYQILRYRCSSLTTFLYLCALELLPTSAFVSAVLFL